jgi:hypothetical protein
VSWPAVASCSTCASAAAAAAAAGGTQPIDLVAKVGDYSLMMMHTAAAEAKGQQASRGNSTIAGDE